MPKYIAQTKTWLSHECRFVNEGEEFTTTFPKVGNQPMRLSNNIRSVEETSAGKTTANKAAEEKVAADKAAADKATADGKAAAEAAKLAGNTTATDLV